MTQPILMAVDGNSLLHRAYHALADTKLHDPYGRPVWALKGMLNLLCAAVNRIGPDALVVGFDSPGPSLRSSRYPDYKATRGPKAPELASQIDLAPKMLAFAGVTVRVPAGLEADDVTAAAARLAEPTGWHTVIVTSDRDSFAHISEHCSVLRIVNGGVDRSPLLTPSGLVELTGIRGEQYLDYAALRGDASDNLPGVRGFGEKTASKLLVELGSMAAAWSDMAAGGHRVADAIGNAGRNKLAADGAREAYLRNIDLMSPAPVPDLGPDLGLDLRTRRGTGMLPLDADKVTAACKALGINAYGPVNALATAKAPAAAYVSSDEPAPAFEDDQYALAYEQVTLHPAAFVEAF